MSLGLPWQDREVTEGPVLYVIAEGVSGMGKRKRAWEEQAQCRMQVQFLPVPVQIGASRDRIPFVELAAGIKPVLIVFDTQARVSVGLDENSAKDMGVLVNAAEEIRKATGACVLFVHHESRAGENLRGSTALEGAAATRIRVAKDGPLVCLTNPKQKDAAEADRIDLALKPAGSSAVIVSPDRETIGLPDAEKRVMATFRETFGETIAVSRSDIMEASRLTKSTCCRALKTLVADGLLTNVGTAKRPMYQLPEASP